MGKIFLYTGQAGTGKTTSLMSLLSTEIKNRSWSEFERVLALSFMHGSRQRLQKALKFLKKDHKVNYQCSTIDSFCLSIVNRFRVYYNITKPIQPSENDNETLFEKFISRDTIRKITIDLLKRPSVSRYITNTYPFIVVDEFQDCQEDLFEVVKGLAGATTVLIASDPFQQLTDPEYVDGIEWVKSNCVTHDDLDKNHRTTNNRILTTAASLRIGERQAGPKIGVHPCPGGKGKTFGLAEYHLKTSIYYNLQYGSIAIISPTSNCQFVQSLLNGLSKPYTFKKKPYTTIGPYHNLVRRDSAMDFANLIDEFSATKFDRSDLLRLSGDSRFYVKRCATRLIKKLSIRNQETVSQAEFAYMLEQEVHTYTHFYNNSATSKISFLTVHGAKNREFDTVIVLWSYKAAGNNLQKRKLLYNAVTRARRNVIVIVQHSTSELQDLAQSDLFGLIIDPS